MKQLKELLTLNRVDYKGCVEKTELLDRATRLWHDNNRQKVEGKIYINIDVTSENLTHFKMSRKLPVLTICAKSAWTPH